MRYVRSRADAWPAFRYYCIRLCSSTIDTLSYPPPSLSLANNVLTLTNINYPSIYQPTTFFSIRPILHSLFPLILLSFPAGLCAYTYIGREREPVRAGGGFISYVTVLQMLNVMNLDWTALGCERKNYGWTRRSRCVHDLLWLANPRRPTFSIVFLPLPQGSSFHGKNVICPSLNFLLQIIEYIKIRLNISFRLNIGWLSTEVK